MCGWCDSYDSAMKWADEFRSAWAKEQKERYAQETADAIMQSNYQGKKQLQEEKVLRGEAPSSYERGEVWSEQDQALESAIEETVLSREHASALDFARENYPWMSGTSRDAYALGWAQAKVEEVEKVETNRERYEAGQPLKSEAQVADALSVIYADKKVEILFTYAEEQRFREIAVRWRRVGEDAWRTTSAAELPKKARLWVFDQWLKREV